jgi:hypothetical protein
MYLLLFRPLYEQFYIWNRRYGRYHKHIHYEITYDGHTVQCTEEARNGVPWWRHHKMSNVGFKRYRIALRFSLILELAHIYTHTHRNEHMKDWVVTTSRPSVESPSSLPPCCSRADRSHGNPRGRVQSNSTTEDAPQLEHTPLHIGLATLILAKSKHTGTFPNKTAIFLMDPF